MNKQKKILQKIFILFLLLSLSPFTMAENVNKDSTAKGKIGLDYYFNHEYKNGARFHYTWEDEAMPGYSEIGKLIKSLGAEITSVDSAPSAETLAGIDIYIIVDPDTKAETENPKFISDEDADAIAAWVKEGGILVILANDSANCEFEHLNNLSEKFGIHFNGDSKNKVTGDNFNMGKIDNFPNHPLFKNVKSIYLKEVSTLSLQSPAKALLTHEGNIIMAQSSFGSGFVFALGDPWFYNEYYDNRRLPAEFENYKGAENLFKWLLKKCSDSCSLGKDE